MLIGIQNLYSNDPFKSYYRKGWKDHYEKMGLSANKLLTCITRKMNAGKIPPHLMGKKVKVVCIDERQQRHYFVTIGEKSHTGLFLSRFKK